MKKNAWFIGLMALVVVGLGAMIFARQPSPTSLPGNTTTTTVFEFGELEHTKGNPEARLTLVEFSDFECPACKTYSGALNQVLEAFPDDVRIVYKHFPLTNIHPNAYDAARASVAAEIQGSFWDMHDILFERQGDWRSVRNAQGLFREYAETIGLDVEKFITDMNSNIVRDKVNADLSLANSLRLQGTPTFYLNGELFPNPQSVQEFIARLQSELDILQ